MEAPLSFVSKARTAFHSAAAKAERVFSDFKPDRDSDKQLPKNSTSQSDDESSRNERATKVSNELKNLRWRSASIGTKQDWQDRLRSIKFGRKGIEDTEKVENPAMSVPFYDENLYLLNMKNDLEAKEVCREKYRTDWEQDRYVSSGLDFGRGSEKKRIGDGVGPRSQ